MNIGEKLSELITPKVLFTLDLFGQHIQVIDAVVFMFAIVIGLILLCAILTRNLGLVPGKKQAALEWFVGSANGLAEQWMGHHGKQFAPWFGSLCLFLVAANMFSLLNFIPGIEITPPTKNINVTAAMALVSIVMVFVVGIAIKGPMHFLKTFVSPSPVMLPFKLMEVATKPLSLALRLFGNIFGAFVIMELIYLVIPLFVPALFSVYFDLFDGAIQAFIFSYLSMIYVAEVIE